MPLREFPLLHLDDEKLSPIHHVHVNFHDLFETFILKIRSSEKIICESQLVSVGLSCVEEYHATNHATKI